MRPFLGRDEQGDGIELPRPVHAARVTVDIEGDAVFLDEASCLLHAAGDLRAAEGVELLREMVPSRATSAVFKNHFIVDARLGLVTLEQFQV